MNPNGVFTLTKTNTETETNKIVTAPNGISFSVQYEHLHKFCTSHFLSASVLVSTMRVTLATSKLQSQTATSLVSLPLHLLTSQGAGPLPSTPFSDQ